MAKRSSASSRPAGLTSVKSEDIKSRKWNEAERRAMKRRAAKQAAGYDSDIDYDDVPQLTDEQLAPMVRPRDVRPKVPVRVRLDPNRSSVVEVEGRDALPG